MKIMVLGADGYLGWPTCMYLSEQGHEVTAVDDYSKRRIENSLGIEPLIDVPRMVVRCATYSCEIDKTVNSYYVDVCNHNNFRMLVKFIGPDAIVHYAEQPSAPYSMAGFKKANETMTRNVSSTLSVLHVIKDTNIHLVKLGTMGEYGTPNIIIPEGYIELAEGNRKDTLPFPKQPGSFYHCSKVADSTLIDFCCRAWNIRATDLNQGVVYGMDTKETLLHPDFRTSFHYDSVFGTVLNRFVTQAACRVPLTVYGSGTQTRGYINISDTVRCVELACTNPPESGRMRVMNQFTQQFSVMELAMMVVSVESGACIEMMDNPRVEKEHHFYEAEHTKLGSLGLEPTQLTEEMIYNMIKKVKSHIDSVDKTKIQSAVRWK